MHKKHVISGAIIYQGPSAFDGAPIVAIATGLSKRTKSRNGKTGPMVQVWILSADLHPLEHIKVNRAGSVCGTCKHIGTTCYVQVGKAPAQVWRTFRAGGYPTLHPRLVSDIAREQGFSVRLGAYGDPAALPVDVLRDVTVGVHHTGYTHAWKTDTQNAYRPYVMASVDTPAEFVEARARGWRTFRVRTAGDTLNTRETMCPASEEAGKRTNCATCKLCDGTRPEDGRASISIIVHGTSTAKFLQVIQ